MALKVSIAFCCPAGLASLLINRTNYFQQPFFLSRNYWLSSRGYFYSSIKSIESILLLTEPAERIYIYVCIMMMTATLETKEVGESWSLFLGKIKVAKSYIQVYINILMVLAKKVPRLFVVGVSCSKNPKRNRPFFILFLVWSVGNTTGLQSDRSDDDHVEVEYVVRTGSLWMCARIFQGTTLYVKWRRVLWTSHPKLRFRAAVEAAALILSNWVPSTCNWTGEKKSKKPSSTAVLRLCVNSDFRRGRITSALIILASLG